MKTLKTILFSIICIASLVSCNQTHNENTIVVGASAAPHAEILEVTKDILKEILSDTVGFSNRQENKKLSIASVNVMNHIFNQYAFLKQDLILEANFHKDEIETLQNLANQNNYKVIILYLQGNPDTLFERFSNRIKNENRHPTHCTSDIIDKENFTKYLLSNRKELESFDFHTINNFYLIH